MYRIGVLNSNHEAMRKSHSLAKILFCLVFKCAPAKKPTEQMNNYADCELQILVHFIKIKR